MIFIDAENSVLKELLKANEKAEKLKKNRKIVYISILLVVVSVGIFVSYKQYQKEQNYLQAMNLFNNHSYLEAKAEFLALTDYKEATEYAEKCIYEYGVYLLKQGEYVQAKKQFYQIQDGMDVAEQINECDYQIALKSFNAKDYQKAQKLFLELNGYKDSTKKILEIRKINKYSNYKDDYDNQDLAEELLKDYYYRTWYSYGDHENIIMDEFMINGKQYGVESISMQNGDANLVYFLLDNKDAKLNLACCCIGDIGGFAPQEIYSLEGESRDDLYFSVPEEDIDYYWQQEELYSQQYSDDEVIKRTFEEFENRVSKEAYEKSPGHTTIAYAFFNANYESASVTFDAYNKTYTCFMTGIFTDNTFDVFGTSTNKYFVQAEFIDTGSILQMIDISIR